MGNLIDLSFHPANKRYKCFDEENSILLKKSDTDSDVFDTLEFVPRDLKVLTIPLNIRHIDNSKNIIKQIDVKIKSRRSKPAVFLFLLRNMNMIMAFITENITVDLHNTPINCFNYIIQKVK